MIDMESGRLPELGESTVLATPFRPLGDTLAKAGRNSHDIRL